MIKKLKAMLVTFGREVEVYQLILKDPRTPRAAKWLMGIAITYFLSPIDLIPDFIPILGQLDDLLLVPLLIALALRLIPQKVVADCRQKVAYTGPAVHGGRVS